MSDSIRVPVPSALTKSLGDVVIDQPTAALPGGTEVGRAPAASPSTTNGPSTGKEGDMAPQLPASTRSDLTRRHRIAARQELEHRLVADCLLNLAHVG